MMPSISKLASLSQRYTNHSLRATSVTLLDQGGHEARHIMKVSGHTSETSIKNYAHHVGERDRRAMSATLTTALQATAAPSAPQQMQVMPYMPRTASSTSATVTPLSPPVAWQPEQPEVEEGSAKAPEGMDFLDLSSSQVERLLGLGDSSVSPPLPPGGAVATCAPKSPLLMYSSHSVTRSSVTRPCPQYMNCTFNISGNMNV